MPAEWVESHNWSEPDPVGFYSLPHVDYATVTSRPTAGRAVGDSCTARARPGALAEHRATTSVCPAPVANNTKQRMVEAAARMMRTRGLAGTSFTDVLAASGAARGGIYHHFPGGKAELAREAAAWTGRGVRDRLAALDAADPAAVADEGLTIATAIGADMTTTAGYQSHEVVRDVADAGHFMVVTRWGVRAEADAVLSTYQHDAKLARATALMGHAPTGFVGDVLA